MLVKALWEAKLAPIKPAVYWHKYWENVRSALLPYRLFNLWGGVKTSQAWSDKTRLRPYRFWGYLKAEKSSAEKTSTLAERLHSFLFLSQHPSVPSASYCHTLWCQQVLRQLVSMLVSCLCPITPIYSGLSSSPVSQSRLSFPDSWCISINANLNHSYVFHCWRCTLLVGSSEFVVWTCFIS